MAEPVDASSDFSLVTGDRELVTVRRVDLRTGATLADVAGVHALRGLARRTYPGAPEGGALPVESLGWQVRADQVTLAGGLRKGDRLIDGAGVGWVVPLDGADVTLPRGSGVYVVQTTKVPGA